MTIKAICTDIDGTLLNKDRELSTRTIEAIAGIKDRMPVILASSRMPSAMTHLQAQLGILDHPLICYNGGLILMDGKPIADACIAYDHCKETIELCIGKRIHVSLYRHDSWFAPTNDYWTDREEANTKVKAAILSNKDVVDAWKNEMVGPHKIMCMGDETDIFNVAERLESMFPDNLHVYRSKSTYLEIAPRQVSKASALKYLLQSKFGIDMEQVMAFGDNFNDIEMLQQVGYGVAVGNARDEVKAAAKYETLSAKENGVAEAIYRYIDQG